MRKGLVLLLASLFMISACSNGSKSGGAGANSSSSSGEPVTITHYTLDSIDKSYVEQLVPKFEKQFPNIKVKIAKVPYEQFDSKLQTLIAGGKVPDVTSHWGAGGFAEYFNKDMLLPLDEYMTASNFKAADYEIPENLMKIYQVNGKTYGIPVNMYVTALMYNKDMFEKEGIPLPPSDYEDTSWTFEKMLENAKKLTKNLDDVANSQYGLDFSWSERDMRPLYFGAKVYSDDTFTNGGKPSETYFTSSEVIAAYQKYYDLIHKEKVSPTTEWTKSVAGQNGDAFATGKVGMVAGGTWSLAGANEFSFKAGVAAIPVGPNKEVRSPLYVDPLLILKGSQHPKEAFEWIKFLLTKEIQEESVELSGGTPPVHQTAAEKYYTHFEGINPDDIRKVYQGAIKYGYESYNHLITKYSQINDMIMNELEPLDRNAKSVEEVMKIVQEKVQKILKQ